MTNTERQIFAKNFLARRTSRIVSAQNGFNDVIQFADGYTHDTQADTANGSTDAPDTTTRVDVADVGDSDFDGTVPGGSNDDSAIYGALDVLQKHVASLDSSDLLDLWASTSDALKKTVSSDFVKPKSNPEGTTRDPLHVADNTASQNAGSHGYIPTSELQKMETEASKLTTMTSRIVGVTAL